MITNQSFLNLATAISKSFCSANLVCQTSVYERLKNLLNDDSFSFLLQHLANNGSVLSVDITKIDQSGAYLYVNWNWIDVVRGTSGSYRTKVQLRSNFANDFAGAIGMRIVSTSSNQKSFIMHNYNSPGYGIAITQSQGGEVGGSGSGSGSGLIGEDDIRITQTGSSNSGKNIIPASQTPAGSNSVFGFDLNSLIIPGIILGAFFLLKK